MLNGLFQSTPKPRDFWEARGLIAQFGDQADNRAIARAQSCRRGSRDRAHWQRIASAVDHMLESN